MRTPRFVAPILAASVSFLPVARAEDSDKPVPSATKANYELAARWTTSKVLKRVFDVSVTPHWLDSGDRFWYTWENTAGRKFYIVDPARKSKTQVFDAVRLAALLTAATGLPYDSQHLPMRTIKFVKGDGTIRFDVSVPREATIPGEKKVTATETSTEAANPNEDPQQRRAGTTRTAAATAKTKTLTYDYDLGAGKLTLLEETPKPKPRWASISPDDKTVVFARNHNLYMMDAANYAKALKNPKDATIAEMQLTTDGVEDFSYARRAQDQGDQQEQQLRLDQTETERAAEIAADAQDKNARVPPIMLAWSKDSKKLAMVRRDSLKVGQLWVINSLANPRPTLETYRYTMPGEPNAPQAHLEIFDIAAKSRTEMKAARFADQSVAVATDRITNHNREHEKMEAQWAGPGSDKLYFTRVSRDLHRVDVCSADTATGVVKPLIEERMNIYIETKPLRVIGNGAELIHWSERDGWGHYYLYDSDGKLKNQITHGEFVAEDVIAIDEKSRSMVLTASGREDGEDPYFMHAYRAALDGSGMKLLDAGNSFHAVNASDDGRYFVDNSSRVNTAPVAVLEDSQGAPVLDLEKTDLSAMMEAGYKFPEPFQVKADDGITDIYGVMYKPFDFDPKRKYPLVAYVYPGPQTESVTKTFSPRSANTTLAQLGFIVIEVGNRGGNPHRSKWYHTFGYGNLRDYGLADKKSAIEQLAARYPFIDIEKVGITGHSGGGFMSTAAMLIYPDFFKVAVSESGNHENNIYNKEWSEKHHGVKEIEEKEGQFRFDYEIEKNSEIAKNLKGHLMLVTGDIDNNVHPANTYRLVDALIKANKRFDFMILPGQRHSYGPEAEYFSWLRADYFCKYLLGDFDQSVDMWELNRERQQSGDKPAAATAAQRRAASPEE